MTIRYLAAHKSAPAASKRAQKPGVGEPADDAQSRALPIRTSLKRPIRKEKKKNKNSVLREPKRDLKSSQLSLKARIKPASVGSASGAPQREASRHVTRRAMQGNNPEKSFVNKTEGAAGSLRVAALNGPATLGAEKKTMIPTVKEVGHDGRSAWVGQNQRNAVSNQKNQTVNTQPSGAHTPANTSQWVSQFTQRGCKLQRLPIPVHIEEFFEYGGKAVCSNHVFNFKIVANEADLITEDKPFFNPKFTHQIYNSDETLRGHDDPSIEIFLSPSTLTPFLNWNTRCTTIDAAGSDAAAKSSSCYGFHTHKEDDIQGKLQATFENSLITDRTKFIKLVRNENRRFRPLGKFVTEFTRQIDAKPQGGIFEGLDAFKRPKREASTRTSRDDTVTKKFRVYRVNAQQITFTHLNSHLQAILKFYIESASFIPLDPFWHYFLVYMDNKLVAYATTFDEFLKVPKAPLTISQVLVLPPYQKFGIGSTLLESIYSFYLRVQKCLVMIVEDPADDFQRMKDALDIKMILKAGYFRSLHGLGLSDPKKYLRQDSFKLCGLDHREINEIRTKLKLKKENVLRCFELLQIACLNPADADLHEAYRKYVLRKFTESRDLLMPYFKFENFAEQSMYTFNKQIRQDCRIVEKCCLGNGQLRCMIGQSVDPLNGSAQPEDPYSKAAAAGVNQSAVRPPTLALIPVEASKVATKAQGSTLSPQVPIKNSLSIELPIRNQFQQPASDSAVAKQSVSFVGGPANNLKAQWSSATDRAAEAQDAARTSLAAAPQANLQPAPTTTTPGIGSSVLRANRFTPTPWQEIHGSQVRYLLPTTLQRKIRAAITQFVTDSDSDSDYSESR